MGSQHVHSAYVASPRCGGANQNQGSTWHCPCMQWKRPATPPPPQRTPTQTPCTPPTSSSHSSSLPPLTHPATHHPPLTPPPPSAAPTHIRPTQSTVHALVPPQPCQPVPPPPHLHDVRQRLPNVHQGPGQGARLVAAIAVHDHQPGERALHARQPCTVAQLQCCCFARFASCICF
jgi:hypothetical protein